MGQIARTRGTGTSWLKQRSCYDWMRFLLGCTVQRAIFLLALLAWPPGLPALADPTAGATGALQLPPVVKTGKERLGDKASDEQRVNDCKVPPARRTRDRPSLCPWDVTH